MRRRAGGCPLPLRPVLASFDDNATLRRGFHATLRSIFQTKVVTRLGCFSNHVPVAVAMRLSACCGTVRPARRLRLVRRAEAGAAASPLLSFGYDAGAPLQFVDHGRINRRSEPIAVHDVSLPQHGPTHRGLSAPAAGTGAPSRGRLRPRVGRRPARAARPRAGARRPRRRRADDHGAVDVEPARASSGAEAILKELQAGQVRDVVAVRRAVDVLRSRPQVDPERIGFSAGAPARGRARSSPRPTRA